MISIFSFIQGRVEFLFPNVPSVTKTCFLKTTGHLDPHCLLSFCFFFFHNCVRTVPFPARKRADRRIKTCKAFQVPDVQAWSNLSGRQAGESTHEDLSKNPNSKALKLKCKSLCKLKFLSASEVKECFSCHF